MNSLFMTMMDADFETLKINIEAGKWNVNESDIDGSNLLFYVDYQCCNYLISKGIDIEKKDRFGNTALMKNFDSNVKNIILKAGANVNEINDNKRNALFYIDGDVNAAQLLINHGVNINQLDIYGRNVICYAHSEEIFKIFLKYGIDMKIQIADNNDRIGIIEYIKRYKNYSLFSQILTLYEKEHINSNIHQKSGNSNLVEKKKRI